MRRSAKTVLWYSSYRPNSSHQFLCYHAIFSCTEKSKTLLFINTDNILLPGQQEWVLSKTDSLRTTIHFWYPDKGSSEDEYPQENKHLSLFSEKVICEFYETEHLPMQTQLAVLTLQSMVPTITAFIKMKLIGQARCGKSIGYFSRGPEFISHSVWKVITAWLQPEFSPWTYMAAILPPFTSI